MSCTCIKVIGHRCDDCKRVHTERQRRYRQTGSGATRRPVALAAWMDQAECKGMDPDIFHPDRGESKAAAIAICNTCPVKEQCLEHAVVNHEDGVWGGTGYRERQRIRGQRRREGQGAA